MLSASVTVAFTMKLELYQPETGVFIDTDGAAVSGSITIITLVELVCVRLTVVELDMYPDFVAFIVWGVE